MGAFKFQTLEKRRQNANLCFTYQLTHNMLPVTWERFFNKSSERTRGHQFNYLHEPFNHRFRQQSNAVRTVHGWNALPETAIIADTLHMFKNNLWYCYCLHIYSHP